MSRSLAVCIVVYHPDVPWLTTTLTSLRKAIARAFEAGLITSAEVRIVDNGACDAVVHDGVAESATIKSVLDAAMWSQPSSSAIQYAYVATTSNRGFGAGNNHGLAAAASTADFVLILNPDVDIQDDAIAQAISHLNADQRCAAVTPVTTFPDGTPQFLVKRDPSVGVLALRGFGPGWLKRRFARALDRYDFRDVADVTYDATISGCKIVSGCWLLLRGDIWRETKGFDESFFLYFEDFDLSLRISKIARIDRVPHCRIVHAGGNAAKKGGHHVGMFIRSAIRFFGKHGWRWLP
jgi:GT2 family glycosyltransferase